ncbi:MAG: twitching motility protein PilT [Bacillota bacterium]
MIRVIFGEKGAGNTKRILDMANETLNNATGSIVFIDSDNQYMFDVKHSIRFINASEYEIDGPKMFFGFLNGIAAQDFDLEYLFIDSFLKIVHHPLDTLEGLFEHLASFSDRCNIKLVISISGNPGAIPEFIKPYII